MTRLALSTGSRHRWAAAAAAVGIAVGGGAAPAAAGTAPSSGSGQSFEDGALPPGWTFREYRPGTSAVAVVTGAAADGDRYLTITSPAPNHARVVLPAALVAGTTYRFRASVRATGTAPGAGAVLGVEGRYVVTAPVSTDARWQDVELYLRAPVAATVPLTVGLGQFGLLSGGRADFDDVAVSAVAAVPAGVEAVEVSGPTSPAPAPTAAELPPARNPSPLLWGFAAVLAGAVAAAAVVLRRPRSGARQGQGHDDRAG